MDQKIIFIQSKRDFIKAIKGLSSQDKHSFLHVEGDREGGAKIEYLTRQVATLVQFDSVLDQGTLEFYRPAILFANSYDEVAAFDMVITVLIMLSNGFTFPVELNRPDLGNKRLEEVVAEVYQWLKDDEMMIENAGEQAY